MHGVSTGERARCGIGGAIWIAILTAFAALAQDHAGSDACATCHDLVGDYMESKMARTSATAGECNGCHESRSAGLNETGVACERCHGAAGQHVSASGARALNRKPLCGQCHVAAGSSHAAQLAEAKCRVAGGGRLACTACHDPHRTVPVSERGAYYRAKCRSCHAAAHAGVQGREDCAGCHMPSKAPASLHAARTDHSIRSTRR